MTFSLPFFLRLPLFLSTHPFPRLTAFVLKNFAQARKYIYVDDKNIQDALRWLEQNQLPSGCFATKGNFFHSSLKVMVGQGRKHCWGMTGWICDNRRLWDPKGS